MGETATANWLGNHFYVMPRQTQWYDMGGVYIFAGINACDEWVPLYIGETGSFRLRLPTHERWLEAAVRGAVCIHAMVIGPEASRVAVQNQLIAAYQPTMNQQGRAAG